MERGLKKNKNLEKLLKNSKMGHTAVMSQSEIMTDKDEVRTSVPAMNIALSGRIDGGFGPGLTMFAGPSKHFKSAFAMLLVKSFLNKYEDGAVLFYDSEFGAPLSYCETFGINADNIIHTPITDIEELKHDISNQLQGIDRGDHILIVIDSVGNLASRKETEDAMSGKTVADMTRAKALKSLFRIVTPHLTLKNITCVVVNHTYKDQSFIPRDVVSGGTGGIYGSNEIFIVGRRQSKSKADNEVDGYDFILTVEKSRFIREKSKIPISVRFNGGISQWSGLLEMAMESGHVTKPKAGWFQKSGDDKLYREADTNTTAFWGSILKDRTFREWVSGRYTLSSQSIMSDISDIDINEVYNNVR